MAKFTPGPAVAGISGSTGGTVFSRNRYGAYMRYRAIPVNPSTVYQQVQRSVIGALSQQWQGLDEENRKAWVTWAQNNPISDSLGFQQILTGHVAFVKLNTRVLRMGGTLLTLPPIAAPPAGLMELEVEAYASNGAVKLAFAPTPVGADEHVIVEAAVVNSAGINYVKNLMKQICISAGAQATAYDVGEFVLERYGEIQEGQQIFINARVGDETTGLYSAINSARCTVEAAPV